MALQIPFRRPKSSCTTQLTSEPATYVPHVLCDTCDKADIPSLMREEGFKEDEIDEAIKKARKLEWDVDEINRNATRCRFCTLLLRCLTNNIDAETGLDEHVKVFVDLHPIGEYYDWGELTWWMMLMRKKPVPSREYTYMCQLNVGVRKRVQQQVPQPRSSQSLPDEPAQSGSVCIPIVAEQETSLAQRSMDLPLRRRNRTGYRFSKTNLISSPTSDRELFIAPTRFETRKFLCGRFDLINEVLASFVTPANPTPEPPSESLSAGPSSNGPPVIEVSESVSDICIQLEGSHASGPMNRISWRYETNNIMKSRSIDTKRAALAQASRWIKHCQLWHAPYCRQKPWGGPNSGSLALRVIDIQKLCIVAAPAGCQYAALSYRWGDVDQCKLEKDTYEDMHKPGVLNYDSKKLPKKLPQTIRDAMVVCQGLSIKYLWVDALCIIQDLGEDRDVQIASMGFIYGGAHLTIVAAYGDSANAGLPGISIHRRDRRTPTTIKGVSMNTQPRSAVKFLLNSQWYTRGWTFQELVLSNRVLAFTQDQMFFFCTKATLREDMVLEAHNGVLRLISYEGDKLLDRYLPLSGYLSLGEKDPNEEAASGSLYDIDDMRLSIYLDCAFEDYKKFLAAYLHRQLGEANDILNGVASILDGLSPYLGSFRWGIPIHPSFSAGALTWNFKQPFPLARRQHFPSWSWAGWENVGNLDFHPSLSMNLLDHTPHGMPIFHTFRSNGMALDLHQLHNPDPSNFSSDIFSDSSSDAWLRSTWPLLQATYTQYLIITTEIACLKVVMETVNESTSQSPNGHCAYAIRSGLLKTSARIHLNPRWRCKQPDDMEFVLIRRSVLGDSLMLIRRSGPIAYRIQMVEEPVNRLFWRSAKPRPDSIILG